MSLKTKNLLKITLSTILTVLVITFNSCDTTTTSTTDCSISITNFTLSTSSANPGDDIKGTVVINDKIGLSSTEIQSLVGMYLSTDGTYSANDNPLTSFVDVANISTSGTSVTIPFDQIEIPFTTAAGSYNIIAHVPQQNCGGGVTSVAANKTRTITIN